MCIRDRHRCKLAQHCDRPQRTSQHHGSFPYEQPVRQHLRSDPLLSLIHIFTYGYKGELHEIKLTFSPEDFPHLAGFHYLKDIALPRYSPRKTVDMILSDKITYDKVKKGTLYQEYVKPRLLALVRLKEILEQEFDLFSYMPQFYPFVTKIKADYLISSRIEPTAFVFIIRESPTGNAVCDFLCCSAFEESGRDYRANQRSRTLLKKERVHIETQDTVVLYDRLPKNLD